MNDEKKIEADIDPVQYLYNQGWKPAKAVSNRPHVNNCPFCSSGRKKHNQNAVCAKISSGDYWARVSCYHCGISYLVYQKDKNYDEQQSRRGHDKPAAPERHKPAEESRLGRAQTEQSDGRGPRRSAGAEDGDRQQKPRAFNSAQPLAPRRTRY